MARYLTSGALDSSFGTNGVSMDLGFAGSFNGLVIQSDGKILAVGSKLIPTQLTGSLFAIPAPRTRQQSCLSPLPMR